MMREYKRYEEYQDSGVEWIGEIPKNWEIIKLKFLLSNIDSGQRETGGGKIDNGVFSLGGEHVGWDGKLYLDSPKYVSEKFYKQMNSGKISNNDILLVKDGATIGKTAYINDIPKGRSVINEHVYRITSNRKIISKLLYYMISGPVGLKQILLNVRGAAQGGLNLTFTDNLVFCLPPKQEQQKIVSFLDQKIAKIDEIINKKEKLIGHLKKYKKSVITEAVTKGKLGDKYINEDAELVDEIKMKDSGVEWIGRIPEYWDIKRLKFVVDEINKKWNENNFYKYIGLNNIESDGGKLINTQSSENINSAIKFKKGDVLFNTLRPYLRKCIVASFEGICTSEIIVLRGDNIYPQLISRIMLSNKFIELVNSSTYGAKMPRASWDFIGNIYIPIFDKFIQKEIVDFLDYKISSIYTLIQKTKESIEKYKEYKKSLIFEAVTGKIDLRDHELKGGDEVAEYNNTSTADRKRVSALN